MFCCYYEVLEFERDVGNDEIKKFYRRFVLKWYLDKNGNCEESIRIFIEI